MSDPLREQPPQRLIDYAVEMAKCSPCRSKRGAVIFRENLRIASGYNFKPRGFDCDGSSECKATCRTEAIHAEQMALLRAGTYATTSDMLHVKVTDAGLVASGGPSCVQCSKLALASGIAGVWLFHDTGWRRYEVYEFHRLSLAGLAEARSRPEGWQPIATAPEAEFVFVWLPNYGECVATKTTDHHGPVWWAQGRQEIVYPTHWRPRFKSPQQEAEARSRPSLDVDDA